MSESEKAMAESGVQSLRERVEQAIATSGETVVSKVVDSFVATEIKRRADLLTAAVNTVRQLEADFRKMKPDVQHVNEDGSPAVSLYTPAKQKERVKHREKMAKLEAAISLVLDKHDADSYNKLDQQIKKSTGKGGGDDKDADKPDDE
jgi:hypothetical protein